jgi:hypothetical protein
MNLGVMVRYVVWDQVFGALACRIGRHDIGYCQRYERRRDGEVYGIRQTWYCRRCGHVVRENLELID